MARSQSREPCVVDAAPLAGLVRRFVDRWNVDRPPLPPSRQAGAAGPSTSTPVGAVTWMSAETGVPRGVIEKLLAGKLARVGLGTADALLQAIGRPDALWNDEVSVQGNPHGGLRFGPPRSYARVEYSATISLAGHPVGRVRRQRAASRYLAFDAGGRVVADASTIGGLRRELLRRRTVADAYCCGGSLTGDAAPRPSSSTAASLNGSLGF